MTRHPAWSAAIGALVLAVIVIVLIVTLSGSVPKHAAAPSNTSTTRPRTPIPRLELHWGRTFVHNVGPPVKVPKSLRRGLLLVMQRYVNDAIIAPLETGHVVRAYQQMYDPFVKRFALGRDVAVLTEARTGFFRKRVTATAVPMRLDVLGGPDGHVALFATTLLMRVRASTPRGRLAIRRTTELTFAEEGRRWLVTAYRVGVRRALGRSVTTAAARAG